MRERGRKRHAREERKRRDNPQNKHLLYSKTKLTRKTFL
jgi:hypothetical protein